MLICMLTTVADFLVIIGEEQTDMPLIKCPDCGKDISDKAVFCVGCGRPFTTMYATQLRATTEKRKCKKCGVEFLGNQTANRCEECCAKRNDKIISGLITAGAIALSIKNALESSANENILDDMYDDDYDNYDDY